MKNLIDFIFEKSIDLSKSLDNHLFIEYLGDKIFESNGIYDYQRDIVKYVLYKIKNNSKDVINILANEFDFDVFFKEIKLVKSNETSYDPMECDYLDNEGVMDKVYITYNPNSERLTIDLIHEFTHAWDDYNSYVKEAKVIPIEIASSDKYNRTNVAKEIAIKLNKLTNSKKFDAQKYCGHAIYSLSKIEQLAFKSEVHAIFIDHEIHSYKEALDLFRETRSYKDFEKIKIFIDNISEEDKQLFIKTWNKVNDSNSEWKSIYKKINRQLINYFESISKHIARAYYDYIQRRGNKK